MSDPIVLSYHDTLLRASDLRLLDPPNWLNDRIISFCFQHYEYQLFPDGNFVFISPDVAQFVKLSPPQELDIFFQPLDLKNKDIVFLPVNDSSSATQAGGGHWSLLVYRKNNREFYHYDSSGNFNRKSAQLMAKKLATYLTVDVSFADTSSPQQQNSHDCGVYVVCVVEHICQHAMGKSCEPLSRVVTAESVKRKRNELKKLIIGLGKDNQ